jgi:hypothetical protein
LNYKTMNMNKNKPLLALLLTSAFLMALPLYAQAAPQDKPIQVYLEGGSKVAFDAEPVIEDGSTLVQFRPIFEKLGLTVDWNGDTQTVTGTGKDVELKLQIGSNAAFVNGKEVKLAVAPRIVNDHTFVPLRFVGEASGLEVGWDGYNRNIVIAPIESQAAYTVTKSLSYFVSEDLEGLMSCYDENSPEYPLIRNSYAQQLSVYDAKPSLKALQIVNRPDADHAIVQVTKEIDMVKGPELKDSTVTTLMQMAKVSGEWKLSAETVMKEEVKVAPEWIRDDKPEVKADEKKAILAALEKFRVLTEKEDVEALQAMTDPGYPNLAASMMGMKQLFAMADFTQKNDNVTIIQYTDKEAMIRYTAALSRVKGPEQIPSIKSDTVDKWKKNDKGEWILADSKTLTTEYSYAK